MLSIHCKARQETKKASHHHEKLFLLLAMIMSQEKRQNGRTKEKKFHIISMLLKLNCSPLLLCYPAMGPTEMKSHFRLAEASIDAKLSAYCILDFAYIQVAFMNRTQNLN